MIVAGLARHYRALARAQELGPGATGDAVSAATGMKGYPAQKVAEQARSLRAAPGARAVARVARLELDIRVSAQRDSAVLHWCSRRRRATSSGSRAAPSSSGGGSGG